MDVRQGGHLRITSLAVGVGTEVTVRHTSTEHAGAYEQGWNDVLDRLPGHLRT
ncbi:hypothetical protein [uncultured Serinicoccus sp.]|uniref:hypothetical protein n=1 Tax=uncultured Serinicoccus sp. TaxID=735514 RepID=UPI00262D5BDA|nr:hypothetical protein [uncultured Serinicoccus sp.]